MTRYDQAHVESIRTALDMANAIIRERDREIEVLTTERDNALLRIEELERGQSWAADALRDGLGGVNPNA